MTIKPAVRRRRPRAKQLTLAKGLAFGLVFSAVDIPRAWAVDDRAGLILEEIIVSARKRDETLLDVPVSVAAFSAIALEKQGIADINDVIGRTPGLYFSSSVASPVKDYIFLVIRGVGANSGGEPSAATFVDGVYSPSLGIDIGFLDLERVEVLRGPQGTLFGRNTQAGALNIVTRRPDEERRAKVAFEIDEFETYRAQGMVSGPVIDDSLFMSAVLDVASSQGYATNEAVGAGAADALGQGKSFDTEANDYRSGAARTALRYLPSERVEIYAAADYSLKRGNDVAPGFRRGCDCYDTQSEFQLDYRFENAGAVFSVDMEFDAFTLTSITGARLLRTRAPFDFDGTSEFVGNIYDLRTKQTMLSEELRLTSSGSGPLQWIGGLYLFDELHEQDRDFSFPDLDSVFAGMNVDAQVVENKRTGAAVFGQFSYQLSDTLELALGGRYSYEEVDNEADVDYQIPLIGFNVDFEDASSADFDQFTPMASLSYRPSDDLMLYLTYAHGFKAGGYQKNTATLESNIPFDSETSRNYEAGIKMRLANGRINVDASVYRIDLRDQQLQTIVEVGAGNVPVSAIDNAGKGFTQGFELSSSLLATSRLRIDANVGYVEAEYDEYFNDEGLDRSGDPFPYVPDWTARLGVEYRLPVADSGRDLLIYADYRYVGGYETGTATGIDPLFDIDAYDRLDLRLSLESDRWDFTVFAENLLDSYDVTHVWNAFFFADNALNYDQVLPPRRLGARLTYTF